MSPPEAPASAQAEARLQQHTEELCAAAIRALAGERDLHFRGRRLHRGRQRLPLFAPHLHPKIDEDDFGSFRGAADGLALRLSRSDPTLHQRLCPAEPVDRLVFELLEQLRVESLVPEGMPGVKHNLRHRFEQWSLAFHRAGLNESARGILLYTVAQISRSRVTGEPVTEETEDLMETTRGAIVPVLGHDLAGLRRTRDDQAAYAVHALAIARLVGEMVRSADDETGDSTEAVEGDDPERAAFSLLMELDANVDDTMAEAAVGRSRVLEEAEGRYRVFTTAHDREASAAALTRPDQLQQDRERLDTLVARQGINLQRLARDLITLLAEPQDDGWDGGQEQGRIDGRRLAQLIASPIERRLFRTERQEPKSDCVLAFLLDCSGSMRQHAERIAPLVDTFARALDMAGVANELLGFTTGAWNGGKAMRDWVRAGRPAHPGRLNEALHIVFKDAATPWRRGRAGLAALFKGELFKEGLDGEAVEWAVARLEARSEPHKLLVVVSDACPMDGATNLANDPNYLDHHLQDVVQRVEAAGRVRIHGLGVGLDLSPYYSRSQALDLAIETPAQVVRETLRLLAQRGGR